MKNRPCSVRDIARIAGVSPAAVSYVLNAKPGVSDKTREKILDVIEKLGYRDTQSGGDRDKSRLIYLVIDNERASFDDLFYNSAMMGILECCGRYGYHAVLTVSSSAEGYALLRKSVEEKKIGGAIFLQTVRQKTADVLHMFGVPFVLLDAHMPVSGIPCVLCDYRQAAKKAVGYLIRAGHRRIAYLGYKGIPAFFESVLFGYREALAEAGLSYPEALSAAADTEKESVSRAVASLLPQKPDAVFCAGDMLGVLAEQCIAEAGFRVPDDISVIAVDNISVSQFSSPPLSTVNIEKEKLGAMAVQLLLMMIVGKEKPDAVTSRILAPGEIVERSSVKKLPDDRS